MHNFQLFLFFVGLLSISSTFAAIKTYTCNQQNCSTGDIEIGPDQGINVDVYCEDPNSYVNYNVPFPFFTYNRSSSIETCWLRQLDYDLHYLGIGCQNWNTIWGDSHSVNIMWNCQPTQ